jgi:uncharacterized protein YndB with AHSA1/START domain
MPIATITPDQDAVISEIEIAAPPDRVFQALITREQALQWGAGEAFQITQWDLEPRLGGKWGFTAKDLATGREYVHYGEVIEFNPPRVLSHTWFAKFHKISSQRTLVRWDLTPTSTGTLLKVTHSGLSSLPEDRTSYSQGWPGLLDAVRKFVEK